MKIAIVKLSALGDIVHAMIVLQFIKSVLPHSRIDWFVEEVFADVLQYNPDINAIHTINLKSLKHNKYMIFSEFSKLRAYAQEQYDIVVDMQGLIKSAIVSRILGRSAGFDKNSIREKAASILYHQKYAVAYDFNIIRRNIALISAVFGMHVSEEMLQKKRPFLFYDGKDGKKTVSFLRKDRPNIIYIIGSSWASKVYPKEKFVEIIEALEGNHLLVWGNEQEYRDALYIQERSNARILPSLNLNELKALIGSANLVIGGDSGPTHFAWAMNRPSITLFGPTPSDRNALPTPINRILDCGEKINPFRLDRRNSCIANISTKKIILLAREIL